MPKLLLLGLLSLWLSSHLYGRRINAENCGRIKAGMGLEQVERIIGKPTKTQFVDPNRNFIRLMDGGQWRDKPIRCRRSWEVFDFFREIEIDIDFGPDGRVLNARFYDEWRREVIWDRQETLVDRVLSFLLPYFYQLDD